MADLEGVLLGGVLALAGSMGTKLWDEWRLRKTLRAAFRAEVKTIIHGAEVRGHEELFRGYVDHWEKTKTEMSVLLWGFDNPVEDPVFDANVGKIGNLGPDVAEDIGLFYGHVRSIRVDLIALKKGELAGLPAERRVDVFRKALGRWDEAKEVARRLLARL